MAEESTRYVALLRGINLGRARQVDMPRLREALTARGHGDVRTHLRSGNVVLASALPADAVAESVATAVREEFGFEAAVVVRTGAELAAVVAADPLRGRATDPAHYLVTFLPREPGQERVAALPPAPLDDGSDYRVLGRELYQWLPGGVLRSSLSGWKWETLLGCAGTARNWNTVRRLAEMTA